MECVAITLKNSGNLKLRNFIEIKELLATFLTGDSSVEIFSSWKNSWWLFWFICFYCMAIDWHLVDNVLSGILGLTKTREELSDLIFFLIFNGKVHFLLGKNFLGNFSLSFFIENHNSFITCLLEAIPPNIWHCWLKHNLHFSSFFFRGNFNFLFFSFMLKFSKQPRPWFLSLWNIHCCSV